MKVLPDFLLYHYTDANGLIGIIKNRELWATNILHLNDATEFKHAVETVQQHLRSPAAESSEWTLEALSVLLRDPDSVVQMGQSLPFVFSFSENPDQLSQWRAYCPEGNGFSIGFRARHLYALMRETGFRLIGCEYTSADKERLLLGITTFMNRGVRWINRRYFYPDERRLKFTRRLYQRSWLNLAGIKDQAFREEREWRLVGFPNEELIDYRPGRFGVLPYCKLPLCPDNGSFAFEDIYIGPNQQPEVAAAALYGILQKVQRGGLEFDKIKASRVPLRY